MFPDPGTLAAELEICYRSLNDFVKRADGFEYWGMPSEESEVLE